MLVLDFKAGVSRFVSTAISPGTVEEVAKMTPREFYTAYHSGLQERYKVLERYHSSTGIPLSLPMFITFLFILAGGPLVESTHGKLHFTAPLTAITAAVVGVIVSLAVFFAVHVFHLAETPARWDWVAMAITAVAAIALMRYKVGTIRLIAACAAVGLVVSYLPLKTPI